MNEEIDEDFREENKAVDAFVADGHTKHCACRLVWGDGECECRRQQNWLTPKPTTVIAKDII